MKWNNQSYSDMFTYNHKSINTCTYEAYTFVELFCGDAWVSRVMRASGHPTASLDIRLQNPKEGKQNAFDMLSDAGFSFLWVNFTRTFKKQVHFFNWLPFFYSKGFFMAFLGDQSHAEKESFCQQVWLGSLDSGVSVAAVSHSWCGLISYTFEPPWMKLRLALITILNCRMDECLVLIGLLCSSFVAINRGTNKRYPFSPLGDESYEGVRTGNMLTTRNLGFGVKGRAWRLLKGNPDMLDYFWVVRVHVCTWASFIGCRPQVGAYHNVRNLRILASVIEYGINTFLSENRWIAKHLLTQYFWCPWRVYTVYMFKLRGRGSIKLTFPVLFMGVHAVVAQPMLEFVTFLKDMPFDLGCASYGGMLYLGATEIFHGDLAP